MLTQNAIFRISNLVQSQHCVFSRVFGYVLPSKLFLSFEKNHLGCIQRGPFTDLKNQDVTCRETAVRIIFDDYGLLLL